MPCAFFFFNDTATTEIYTLSLHDALPICVLQGLEVRAAVAVQHQHLAIHPARLQRSEEHTSELQSHSDLVCRLLLEKKKYTKFRQDFIGMHSRSFFVTPLTSDSTHATAAS